jgi:hypothetical protein
VPFAKDFTSFQGVSFKPILGVSFVGGVVGAVLLLSAPERTFDIVATIVFFVRKT